MRDVLVLLSFAGRARRGWRLGGAGGVATLRPAPPPARAPAPIRGGYARHRGYTRLGHESAGDRVSTDVCVTCVSVGRVYPSALWRMGDHQHASTSFGMRTSRSSSARLSCASVVVCLAPVNCVLSLSALARPRASCVLARASAGSRWSSPRQKKPECRKRSACTKPVACTRIRKWRVRVRRTPQSTPQLLSRGGDHNTPRCELRALERTPIAEHGMRAASATQDARRIENFGALW